MATLIHLDACEHGVYSTSGAGLWSNVTTGAGSTWTRDTTNQRSGAACHKGVFAAGVAHGLRYPTMSGDAIVARFYVKFDSLPTGAATEIAYFSVASGTFGFLVYDPATGLLGIRHGTITNPQWDSVQVVAGQFYRIDLAISGVTGTTWTLHLQVDGRAVADSVHSGAVASATAAFGLGTFTTTAAIAKTLYFDDVAVSQTIADFPIGAGHVVALQPGSDGTHSFTANDFSTGDAGTLRAPTYAAFWQSLVTQPWTTVRDTAVNICQRVIRTTGYVEIAPATTPETGDAKAVMAKMAYSSSSTAANTMGTIVRNGSGTAAVLFGDLPVAQGGNGGALADYSESTNFFKSVVVPNPGTWTPTAVNAIRFRMGGSSDVTPLPTVQSLLLVAEYADAAGTNWTATPADTLSLADATSPSQGFGRLPADALSLADAQSFDRAILAADALALADSVSFNRAVALAEALSLADAAQTAAGFSVAVADLLSLADSLSAARGRSVSVDDALAVSDALAQAMGLDRSVADTLGLADALASSRGIDRTIADTLALADSLAAARGIAASVADPLALADALRFDRLLAVADAVSILDTAAPLSPGRLDLADTVTLGDVVALSRALQLALADAVSPTDDLIVSAGRTLALAEALSLSDALELQRDVSLSVSDSVPLADLLAFQRAIELAEQLVLSDEIDAGGAADLLVGIADDLGISDLLDHSALRTTAELAPARLWNEILRDWEPVLRTIARRGPGRREQGARRRPRRG